MIHLRFTVLLIALSLFLVQCKTKKIAAKEEPVATVELDNERTNSPMTRVESSSAEPATILTFSSEVFFATNSSVLTEEAKSQLEKVKETIGNRRLKSMEIGGYTDATGTENYNKWLSDRRANSVKTYLESKGFDSSQIKAEGFGSAKPVDTNKTPEGRAKNRRVEVKLVFS